MVLLLCLPHEFMRLLLTKYNQSRKPLDRQFELSCCIPSEANCHQDQEQTVDPEPQTRVTVDGAWPWGLWMETVNPRLQCFWYSIAQRNMSQSLGSAPLINLIASLVSWSFWGMRWTSNLSRHVSFCNTTRGKKIIKPCSFPHVLVFNLGNYRTIPMWILAYLFWSKSTNQLQLSCLSVVVDQKNI